MRKLLAKDAFKLIKIIKKLDLKTALKEMYSSKKVKDKDSNEDETNRQLGLEKEMYSSKKVKDKDSNEDETNRQLGLDIAFVIIENMDAAENEIFELLASVSDKTVNEIRELELSELIAMIRDIFVENDLASFFKSAVK